MKFGYKAYDTKPDYVKTYLELLGGKLVQRNKYIDRFINSDDSLFVPVKILQDDEDLDTVLDGLAKETTKRNLKRAILIGNSEGKKLIGKIEILMIKALRKLYR